MKMNSTESPSIVFNGINGVTNDYLHAPMSLEELSSLALGEVSEPAFQRRLEGWNRSAQQRAMGPKEGVDTRRLEEAGWAVVFAEDCRPEIAEALLPLLRHRQQQAGQVHPARYRELRGREGYRRGESSLRFLARHGVGPGPADPDRLPYFLLLIGGPEEIPYQFQYQLDIQYAVGRIGFETAEEYARYAESVLSAERGEVFRPRRVAFFGVREKGDVATELTHDLLVDPLAQQLRRDAPDWEIVTSNGPEATKDRLQGLLGGSQTPALLFTGSHGVGFEPGHPRQVAEQGSLVCQGRSGPKAPSRFFSAAEVTEEACPAGLISFNFACYSAGTPARNNFSHRGAHEPQSLGDRAFLARLPQRLLAHPRGGALAVVGHVDRAWTLSFRWPSVGREIEVFSSCLRRLLSGHPVGSAMEYFNQRYAQLTCALVSLRQEIAFGTKPDPMELARLWTACHDSRNFVILGDPAVRLAVPVQETGPAG